MQLETKAQIAKATLTLLTIVTSLFMLGVLVLVLCSGLQINPFRETTTEFLLASFAGLAGVAAVLVLLNVATSVSLIADAKIAELSLQPRPGLLKKWSVAFVLAAVVLTGIVLVGTYISKARYIGIVRKQADEVLAANKTLLDEVSRLLASGKPEDYKRIAEISLFLENQRTDFPKLTIIYAGKFADKTALYKINEYPTYDQGTPRYVPSYFTCTQNFDCDYLARFFSGQNEDVFQKYTIRDEQFHIYIPIVGNESRYVLLFERTNYFGKLGS